MSGNTIVNYAVAIVVGVVVAVATAGTGLAAYSTLLGTIAFSATAGAMSYYNRPGMPGLGQGRGGMKSGGNGSVKDASAGQLEIMSASEAVNAAVIFGTVRLAGNMIRYDRATFRTEPIIQRYKIEQPVVNNTPPQQAGKGGGGGGSPAKEAETKITYQEQIVGYRYYLSFDVGLCAGPIDAILSVQSSPGETRIGGGGNFSTNYQSLSLSGPEEGGTCRVYRGSATQTRINGDHYSDANSNHRHFAFAHFQDFYLGLAPSPKTYLFTVQRFPRCLDASGAVITSIKTRGSSNPSHPCYSDANPAAILYEVFTDPIWGRGMSPDLIDIASFASASAYFEANNIGLSFALESANPVADAVDQIRSHCATLITWNGEFLRCRCLLDRATEYAQQHTITEDMASEVTFSRPAWPEVPNDLRVTFINRANNFQAEVAHVQDNAAINTVGSVNSQSLQLTGFSNRQTAEAQTRRILGEMSFPRATITFKLNAWHSHLEPGDLLRFVWSEWSAGTATSFFRITQIDDSLQDAQGLSITAAEDFLLVPTEDAEPAEPAAPAFEADAPTTDSDLALGDDHGADLVLDSPAPLTAWEQPPFLCNGDPDLIITCRRPAGYVTAMLHRWTLTAFPELEIHSATSGWSAPGTLLAPPPQTDRLNCREAADAFTFTLANTDDATAMLASANKVGIDADHLANLNSAGTDLLLIGKEILLCGSITEDSPGVFTVRNYHRAAFGSRYEPHSTSDRVAFISQWSRAAYAAAMGPIPTGEPITFETVAVTTKGQDATAYTWTGPETDGSFEGRNVAPYAPELYTAAAVGLNWTLQLRPRFFDRGAGIEGNLDSDLASPVTTLPDGFALLVEPLDSGGTATGPAEPLPATWTPGDGQTPAAGMLAATYTAPASTTQLRLRTTYRGKTSIDAALATP